MSCGHHHVPTSCACGTRVFCDKEGGLYRLLVHEVTCHLPYTILSIVLGFAFLSLIFFLDLLSGAPYSDSLSGYHALFHVFHYIHILFSVIGSYLMFTRFSHNRILRLVVAIVGPLVFCTLSDVILPAAGGALIGMHMSLHLCFLHYHDTLNLLAFVIMGLLCAAALAKSLPARNSFFGVGMHFCHIFTSALASLFYMVSFGFDGWIDSLGFIFLFLVVSVVIPCVMADVIVPVIVAYGAERRNKNGGKAE